ncbi:MAG TPA: Hsp20/alpha crystallin family protein [Candidatus Eisenbacteria bacterium]|nr:Hsp20/alpha crystallin family protein [Candidatus Eisenbacteria bacterium]
MKLIRWNPTFPGTRRELPVLDEFDRLFDGFMTRGLAEAAFTPAIDIEEGADEFTVLVDLPGVSQKDVKVSLMGDTLTVRGERKREVSHKDRNLHRVERTYGMFERSFTFGTPVKSEGIHARFRDGVLEIVVPKAEEAKVREIEIQTAS